MTAKRKTEKAPGSPGVDAAGEMRRRVLAIEITPVHSEVFTAYLQARPWQHEAEDAARREAPNGPRRLRGRFPQMEQAELARLLVEAALNNHRGSFASRAPRPTADMLAMFDTMRADEQTISGTARKARAGDPLAWDACMHYFNAAHRTRIVREGTQATAVTDPIPAEIENLMQECLAGYVARPTPRTSAYLKGATADEVDALVFAVWVGTESGMTATSQKRESVSSIVEAVTGVSRHAVAKLWQARRRGGPKRER